jgi:hypothetical protein
MLLDLPETRGTMLRSYTVLVMERKEKMRENTGMEGRHATRPVLNKYLGYTNLSKFWTI